MDLWFTSDDELFEPPPPKQTKRRVSDISEPSLPPSRPKYNRFDHGWKPTPIPVLYQSI